MKLRLGFVAAIVALFAAFGLCASAEIAELTPDSATGKYELTYSGLEPYTNCVAVAVEGVFDEEYVLDVSDPDINIVYYNVFISDENGDIAMEIVPSFYTDATLFLGVADSEGPVAACYLMKGVSENVADFEVYTDKTTYTVGGLGAGVVYVEYRVEAVDSYGFPSDFPYEDAERTLVDYDGDRISFVENSRAIQLENDVPEGTYSFSITYGDITKTVHFEVKREPSVAKMMTVTMNGKNTGTARISCLNELDRISFDPEKVVIKVEILDQYFDVMDVTYNFRITAPDETVTNYKSNGIYEFVPVNKLNVDDSETYVIKITAEGIRNYSDQARIIVTGVTNYTGEASSLFRAISEAKDYLAQVEDGEILISEENGNDVHYKRFWTTQSMVDNLSKAVAEGVEMLRKISEGLVNDNQITSAKEEMNVAVSRFKFYEGNLRPIESLKFSSINYRLAPGKTQTIEVKAVPSKPSEKPTYYSENPEIATVNEKTGYVTAKSPGEVKIHAKNSDGSIDAYYTLEVYVPVSSIKYNMKSVNLIAGETFVPEMTILPANQSDIIQYVSNKEKVAKVDENGKITAVSAGLATITATSNGKSAKISVEVNSPAVTAMESCIAKPGSQITLPLYIEDAEGIDKLTVKVTYNSNVIKLNGANDLAFAGGYKETVNDGAGNAVSTWENVSFEKTGTGKLIEYNIEILEGVAFGKKEIKFNVEAYTKGEDKVVWVKNKSSASTVIDVGEKDTYTIKLDAGSGGSVYGLAENTGEFRLGDEATVRARPDSSYSFAGWYIGSNKLSTDWEYTFVVTDEIIKLADKKTGVITVQARFTKKSEGGGSGGGGGGGGVAVRPTMPDVVVKQVSPIISNVSSGIVEYGTVVTLTTPTIGATIYYTLDNSTPTVASIPYTEPIVLKSESTTISAVAVKAGLTSSNIARFTYRIEVFPTATPVVKKLSEYAAHIKYAPVTGPYFRPNDAATRYEVMEMLSFLFEVSGGEPEAPEFSDVSDTYKALVDTYAKAGIINGYPEGVFGGFRSITRAELVKILSVLLDMDVSGQTQYNVVLRDISGHWAENNIKAFVNSGYIVGYPEGDFRPDKAVTRAEVVTIINRITKVNKEAISNQYFVDVDPTFWGYADIMASANIPA